MPFTKITTKSLALSSVTSDTILNNTIKFDDLSSDVSSAIRSTFATVSSLSANWGSGGIKNQYRSDYYGSSAVYLGSSLVGISESSPQWTIKKSIYSSSGTFISSVSSINIAWTNRYNL